jgi:hypothetical protein
MEVEGSQRIRRSQLAGRNENSNINRTRHPNAPERS